MFEELINTISEAARDDNIHASILSELSCCFSEVIFF